MPKEEKVKIVIEDEASEEGKLIFVAVSCYCDCDLKKRYSKKIKCHKKLFGASFKKNGLTVQFCEQSFGGKIPPNFLALMSQAAFNKFFPNGLPSQPIAANQPSLPLQSDPSA